MKYYKLTGVPESLLADFDAAIAAVSREEVADGRSPVSRQSAFSGLVREADLQDAIAVGQRVARQWGKDPKVNLGIHLTEVLKKKIDRAGDALEVKSGAVGRFLLMARASRFEEAIEEALAAGRGTAAVAEQEPVTVPA